MRMELQSDAQGLGRRLRRFRVLRQIKQASLAADLGVSQGMLSRWESGVHLPSPQALVRIEAMLAQHESLGMGSSLRRLIESAPFPVHLVSEHKLALLALSPARQAEWRIDASAWFGRSLQGFATPEILDTERRLQALGWFEGKPSQAVRFATSGNANADIPILPSTVVWERIGLADGRTGLLVSNEALV
ncbi:MAG: helix-turn-helix domain-containing protein [Acidovorax sp.]|nr:helix-turn-helix domain-containing protein [Acidovorax sp.]